MMSTVERPSDETVEQITNKRFRRLLWVAGLLILGFTAAGFLWGRLSDSRDTWEQTASGLAAGIAMVIAGSIALTTWPPLAHRFGLPTVVAGDEREDRINHVAVQWGFIVCMLGSLIYGMVASNNATIIIAAAGQAVQMTLLIVLNRRM